MSGRADPNGFVECDACAVKPGSPTLCYACRVNRDLIHGLVHRFMGPGWRLGMIVHDQNDRPWIYTGHRVTSTGTVERIFSRVCHGAWRWPSPSLDYHATFRETLTTKFPDLTGRVPDHLWNELEDQT